MARTRTFPPPLLIWPSEPSSADELFTAWYRREAIPVTRVIAGQFKRRARDVEEVVDEAFLRLHDVCASGLFIENPTGWVVTVARRLMLDRIRKDKAEEELLTAYALLAETSDDIPTIEEILLDRERTTKLRRAIAGLTALERECLMSRARGRKLREIGVIVGLDLRRVAEMLDRIIERLKEQVRG